MQRKLRRQPKKINLFGCRLFMILRVNKMEGRENRVLKDSGKSKHHKMRTAKMLRAGNSEAMESKGPDKKKSARKNRGIKEKREKAGILNSCLLETGKLNFGTVDPCSEYRKKRGTGSGAEGKVGSGRYFYCEKSRHGNLPCRQVIDVKFCRGAGSQPWRIAAMTSCSILLSCSAEGLYACLMAGRSASHFEAANAS